MDTKASRMPTDAELAAMNEPSEKAAAAASAAPPAERTLMDIARELDEAKREYDVAESLKVRAALRLRDLNAEVRNFGVKKRGQRKAAT